MANVLKHRFASAKANGPDATQIQPSHWNDGHIFSGGNAGDLLTRDPTDASFGAKWAAPPTTLGQWVDVPYSASNFVGNGGSTGWTVQSVDQITFCISITGNVALVMFLLQSTDVTGSPGTPLQLVLPSLFPTRGGEAVIWGSDNGVTTSVRARIVANDQVIRLYRLDGANWAVSAGNTAVGGQLLLRV